MNLIIIFLMAALLLQAIKRDDSLHVHPEQSSAENLKSMDGEIGSTYAVSSSTTRIS